MATHRPYLKTGKDPLGNDLFTEVLLDAETLGGKTSSEITEATLKLSREYTDKAISKININTGPVTTDVEFTYDGDYETDAHTWVTNYTGVKIFVRVGDVPSGTINLVGAIATSKTPSNQWLDYSLEITEDKLSEIITKDGQDLKATDTGLTQIFHQPSNSTSPYSLFLICTKPGWYNLAFDNWFETINITQKGVYFFDNRTYGGQSYLSSLSFSVTTGGSSGGSVGGGTIENLPVTPITYTGNEIQMFTRGICIGDSVTEGSFDNDENGIIVRKYSYPKALERLTNIEICNAGIAGATSQTWYESSLDSNTLWGTWVDQQWVWNMNPENNGSNDIRTSLDYSGFDFAVIHLGINDIGMMAPDATIEDTLTVFEWYTNQIIIKLKEANPGIKIFLATIIPSYAPSSNTNYALLNDRINTIVGYNSDVYLLDLNFYSECATDPAYNVIHPTALGYQKLASEVYSMISYIINNNLDEFKEVQFCNQNNPDKEDILTKSNKYTDSKFNAVVGNASETYNTLEKIEGSLSMYSSDIQRLKDNKADSTNVYTKVESDEKYYDKTTSDINYYRKTDVYTKAESDEKYYDKTTSDDNYYRKTDVYTKTETDTIIDSLRSVLLAQGNGESLTVSEDISNFSVISLEGTFMRGTTTNVYFASLLNISALEAGSTVSVSILDGGTAYNFTAGVSFSNNQISTSEPTYTYGNGKTGDATITIQRIVGVR